MTLPKGFKKPSITKIPSVKELCELLGFQHASLKDTTFFLNTSHAWRKSFKTGSGISGHELLQWNDPLVQLNLTDMSERFLEASNNGINNGLRFWSSSRSWNQDSDLVLPDDRVIVVELLKQLFWKQNRYAVNNNQYAQENSEARDGSQEKTTPTPQSTHANKTSPPRISRHMKAPKGTRPKIGTAPEPASAPAQSRKRKRDNLGLTAVQIRRKIQVSLHSDCLSAAPIGRQATSDASSPAVNDRDMGNTELQSGTSHDIGHSSGNCSISNPASSKGLAKIQVPIFIVTREPICTEEQWVEGRFQGNSLSVFINQLSKKTSRDDIEKLILTLKIPIGTVKITVLKDAEDSWQSARKKFVTKVKEAVVEARKRSEVVEPEIFVEPCYEQKVTLDSGLVDDEVEVEF